MSSLRIFVLACVLGLFIVANAQSCTPGYYYNGTGCALCNTAAGWPNCALCTNTTSTFTCTACAAGYFLEANGVGCTESVQCNTGVACPAGQFCTENSATPTCQPCTGINQQCTSCSFAENGTSSGNGQCIQCGLGYQPDPTNQLCYCNSDSATCGSGTTCINFLCQDCSVGVANCYNCSTSDGINTVCQNCTNGYNQLAGNCTCSSNATQLSCTEDSQVCLSNKCVSCSDAFGVNDTFCETCNLGDTGSSLTCTQCGSGYTNATDGTCTCGPNNGTFCTTNFQVCYQDTCTDCGAAVSNDYCDTCSYDDTGSQLQCDHCLQGYTANGASCTCGDAADNTCKTGIEACYDDECIKCDVATNVTNCYQCAYNLDATILTCANCINNFQYNTAANTCTCGTADSCEANQVCYQNTCSQCSSSVAGCQVCGYQLATQVADAQDESQYRQLAEAGIAWTVICTTCQDGYTLSNFVCSKNQPQSSAYLMVSFGLMVILSLLSLL